MRRPAVRPFSETDLEPAARLLAERHERHRAAEPLLPQLSATFVSARLEAEWRRARVSGAVAEIDGALVAYLMAAPRLDGPSAGQIWIDVAGHSAREPERIRDLYRAVAGEWVAAGHSRHVAVVPALAEELAPWYRLGFGQQQAYATRSTAHPPEAVRTIVLRPATRNDADELLPLLTVTFSQLEGAPVFSDRPRPADAEIVREESRWLEDDGNVALVAEIDGRLVGYGALELDAACDFRTPEDAADLALVATLPDVRGTGVGIAITRALVLRAAEHGRKCITADWRVANLEASRFWPARGWRETHYRLYRSIP